jgi:hypothetical protein
MNEQDFRDACAMLAMNGLIRHFDFDKFKQDPARVADWSYLMADAMVEARNKAPEDDGGIATIKKRKYVRKD